ncbi:MAG: hypothetical protein B6I31_00080 [Desulfobacteraceae bacterium 4572_19]|nr:MAG: hypothetical protein B6I31_00080 [Desulfobacteraceae bacterium 4572_19]
MTDNNKKVINFYYEMVTELNINSGILRDIIQELNMGLIQKRIFLKKINIIYNSELKVQHSKMEDIQKKAK